MLPPFYNAKLIDTKELPDGSKVTLSSGSGFAAEICRNFESGKFNAWYFEDVEVATKAFASFDGTERPIGWVWEGHTGRDSHGCIIMF